jgi:hypothetical protein
LPRQNEWISAVAEALITSLQPNASKQLKDLSAYFADLLFLTVLVSGPKIGPGKSLSLRHVGMEWLFLELAEVG